MPDLDNKKSGQLGTFAGVFTPSVLTILGIILFLRLGYVVGNAGLLKAMLMIGIANLISVLTSFSLAAIATNMKVKGGGDYYLISRTLGIEFGGAIGIVLFLAQSISIAFYCIGFGESLNSILGSGTSGNATQLIAGSALVFLLILAWMGADLATKFQYVVMTFLVLALASFYIGGIGKWETQTLIQNCSVQASDTGFWLLFAIFFPAVTGFTQGVSMSGDLKDPGSSLPRGTFSAVILSILVYFSVAVVFSASNEMADLATDYGAMKKTAYWGGLIDAGVIAATLSSAMASFLGAPRILQALSSDRIFPFLTFFEKGYGKTGNPRRAVMLSFVIAALTIALGELDLIAGIVSMFFLISYGLLNYATYYEAAAESPSFRPRFKWYHKRLSLLGFVICLAVMLAIDYRTGVAAVAILFAIFQYLKRTATQARWSDSRRSHHLKTIREHLLAARRELEHPREWRPVIIALSNDSHDMDELVEFACLIEGNSGMTSAVQVVEGTGYSVLKRKQKMEKDLRLQINEKNREVFPLVISTEDIATGLPVLFQSYGIGPVQANTVLINWHHSLKGQETQSEKPDFRMFLRSVLQTECNIVILDRKATPADSLDNAEKTIDVWWKDDDTSRLMLLLAYLSTRHDEWTNARIRLLVFHLDVDSKNNMDALTQMLEEIRIEASPQIILGADKQTVLTLSKNSDLVFFPVFLKDNVPHVLKTLPAADIVPQLKTVALVMAAQKMDLAAEPEEGKPAELAQILNELEHSEKRVALTEKRAKKAARTASDMMASVKIDESLADPQVLKSLKNALLARETARSERRKAKVERSKLTQIMEKAKDEGIQVETKSENET